MSALQSFLADLRAVPEIQRALAAGTVTDGKPIADHFAALEEMVDYFEHSSDDAAIEGHDRMLKIVTRGAPLKQRLEAIVACRLLSRRR